ncbi:MAG: DNA-binding protein [Deltaproteobacteria bacterium]|nr:DNA-binding protein [Deltaproteobacteria bacterium]
MKKQALVLFLALIHFAATGCGNSGQEAKQPSVEQAPAPAGYSGTVAETMNAAGYTYVLLDTDGGKIWFAGPECTVKVGEKLNIRPGLKKTNFTSKTFNRTFETIYFVESLVAAPGSKAVCSVPSIHSSKGSTPAPLEGSSRAAAPAPAGIDFAGIKKPAGGKTIAEIFMEKKALAGKSIALRGKVVKFSPDIMGKNWVHVQDGTGAAGTNDLTVTTLNTAKAGDSVLVEGLVAVDKDFGYGYKYDVLIDNATLKTE